MWPRTLPTVSRKAAANAFVKKHINQIKLTEQHRRFLRANSQHKDQDIQQRK